MCDQNNLNTNMLRTSNLKFLLFALYIVVLHKKFRFF